MGDDSPPYPSPVQFDKALAAAAVNALQDALINLDTFTQADVAMAEVALRNWRGRYADSYRDRDFPWIKSEAGRVKTELQNWIKKIQQATDDATRLQRMHDAANAEWRNRHRNDRNGQ
jgi:hypothetical protein